MCVCKYKKKNRFTNPSPSLSLSFLFHIKNKPCFLKNNLINIHTLNVYIYGISVSLLVGGEMDLLVCWY